MYKREQRKHRRNKRDANFEGIGSDDLDTKTSVGTARRRAITTAIGFALRYRTSKNQ
jgi:hypothetical protein